MVISLFQYKGTPRAVNKNGRFTGFKATENSVQLKEPSSITDPRLILVYNKSYLSCNYLYIKDFNRYYFINNINVLPGGCLEINAHVDVLYTYSQQILNSGAFVERKSNTGVDTDLIAQDYPLAVDNDTGGVDFSSGGLDTSSGEFVVFLTP